MNYTSASLSELDQRIVDLVQQAWDEHRTPLLLSRLGAQDGGEIARMAKQESMSLAGYLRDRLADDVRVIQHSTKPVVVGAIPVDVESQPGDFDQWLERTHGQTVGPPPRFHPAFWAAFRVPLDEEKRRYMATRPPLRFVDAYPEDRPEGDSHLEIEWQYIDSHVEPSEVQQNVEEWLEANGLEAEPFLSTRPNPRSGPSDDLLGRLIGSLEPDDLRRVSMPLDVIAKLRRHSGAG